MPKIAKIKQFNREEVRRIGVAIEDVLQKVATQYGVDIKILIKDLRKNPKLTKVT